MKIAVMFHNAQQCWTGSGTFGMWLAKGRA
jgi:hypothetical protein